MTKLLFYCIKTFQNHILTNSYWLGGAIIAIKKNLFFCFFFRLPIPKNIPLHKILKNKKINYHKLVGAINWRVQFLAIRTIQGKLSLLIKFKIGILSKAKNINSFLKIFWRWGHTKREREREWVRQRKRNKSEVKK